DFAWPHLASADPAVRFAAQTAIEHQPLDLWRDRQFTGDGGGLSACLALARSGDPMAARRLAFMLSTSAASRDSVSDTIALLQVGFLCFPNAPEEFDNRVPGILSQWAPLFPHPAAKYTRVSPSGTGAYLNRELARFIGQFEAQRVRTSIVH